MELNNGMSPHSPARTYEQNGHSTVPLFSDNRRFPLPAFPAGEMNKLAGHSTLEGGPITLARYVGTPIIQ